MYVKPVSLMENPIRDEPLSPPAQPTPVESQVAGRLLQMDRENRHFEASNQAQAMYNRRLFSIRQEPEMPAKKTASKKRAKVPAKKKSAVKKTAGRKVTSRKKVASKKKVAKKKVAKKAAKKKVAKKAAAGKASKTKVTKKTVTKKKVTKKKAASKKKAVAKKATAKKATASKTATRKAPAKKAAAKKTSTATRKTAKKARRGDILSNPIHGIAPYSQQRGEDYMSDEQLDHFRQILTAWKRELMFEVDRTVHHMQDEAANFPDPNDRATQESEFGLELRTRDRERKLLRKIEAALSRIDDGSYGYCDETGEEIGLKRLEARPVATLCLEAQERREMAERQFRDRDDRYR